MNDTVFCTVNKTNNAQVSVYKLNLESDIKLVQETTKSGNVMIVHMKVYEDKILIADLMRSMSVYKYKEKEGLLEEVCLKFL